MRERERESLACPELLLLEWMREIVIWRLRRRQQSIISAREKHHYPVFFFKNARVTSQILDMQTKTIPG